MASVAEDGPKMKSFDRKKLQSIRLTAIKKGVLTHEVDEGSLCLKCGDACPGFSLHFWRKICKNCLCPREEHNITDEGGNKERMSVGKILFAPEVDTLNRRTSDSMPSSSPRMRRPLSQTTVPSADSPSILKRLHNFVWTPKGCSVEEAQAYFNSLPSKKSPVRATPGEKYRQKQLIRQLPAHDVDVFYCNELTDEERKQMELFVRMRKDKCVGRGEVKRRKEKDKDRSTWACNKCKLPIETGQVAVFAERSSVGRCWHPTCFTCSDCDELLVDLIYFYHTVDHRFYCGRHHAEKIKPRCAACDELILCHEYTRAENQDWHLTHFCCLRCDTGLGGKQYRPQDGQPYCLSCYELSFASVCETCHNSISLDQARLHHGDQVWHGTDDCFKCSFCGDSLIGQPFLPKYGKIFCSKEHAKRCMATQKA